MKLPRITSYNVCYTKLLRIADVIGRQVMRIAGRREIAMIVVIMITGAVLSAFMNNIGVAALMLPVAVDIARRTRLPASRLLMPLAYGSLLGGLTTLVGTPPNLLVSGSLSANGFEPFGLFDFTPVITSYSIHYTKLYDCEKSLENRTPPRERGSRIVGRW